MMTKPIPGDLPFSQEDLRTDRVNNPEPVDPNLVTLKRLLAKITHKCESQIRPSIADVAQAIEILVDIITALQAQLPTWQPIETAPKDGRWILLGWFELPGQKGVQSAFWNNFKDTWCGAYVVFNNKGYPVPTHWMPISDPPE